MISNFPKQLNMGYFCDVCDKTIKLKSKNNHTKSLIHIQYEKSSRINHTFKNPIFFDVDKIFNIYITNHNKKLLFFLFYLVNCGFKIVFNKFTPHIKTMFCHKNSFINLKGYLLYWIEFFIERACKFFHIIEMNFTTINDEMDMTYEHHIKEPMQAVEIRLNMIIAKNLNSINSII